MTLKFKERLILLHSDVVEMKYEFNNIELTLYVVTVVSGIQKRFTFNIISNH
uniref:Uncharacterized protein n=1 Tax=Arion vulgaris TaxID=1028688 RepID=A0A0B6Y2E8_9EUPU